MFLASFRKGRQYCPNWRVPKEDDVWSGPHRKISFGIFEICWGQAVSRSTFAASSTGYFDRDVETDLVDMERARMKVTRVCIYHVDHDAAGRSHAITGEIFARMLFECICHQVTIVSGDANRLAYQKANKQLNSSYSMSTCQFWTERMETNHGPLLQGLFCRTTKTLMSDSFHSISYLDLKYLREKIGGRLDFDDDVRRETDRIGECCLLTFFEYGLSTPAETFNDGKQQ